MPGPDDVDAHPTGASPFGVEDMVGNVWQYTGPSSRTCFPGLRTFLHSQLTTFPTTLAQMSLQMSTPGRRWCGAGPTTGLRAPCGTSRKPSSSTPTTSEAPPSPFLGDPPPHPRNPQTNRYLLMDDSYERAGALGFRCAQDAVQAMTVADG